MLEFAALALALGVKHSFDADHLIAVSNLLSNARSAAHAARMSAYWAFGHMLAASLITLALLSFKDALLPLVLDKLELAVAAMLVFLGAASITRALLAHSHRHLHAGRTHEHFHVHLRGSPAGHSHRHMFGVGVVHGLASNDELLVLLTASLGAASAAEMIAGVGIFSAGVALGMLAFAFAFTLPVLRARGRSVLLMRGVNLAVGLASIGYGVAMFSE